MDPQPQHGNFPCVVQLLGKNPTANFGIRESNVQKEIRLGASMGKEKKAKPSDFLHGHSQKDSPQFNSNVISSLSI